MSPASATIAHDSLKRKVLLPLLLLSGCLAAIIIVGIRQKLTAAFTQQLLQRGEIISHAVNYATESLSHQGELQRIVSAIGAEEGVLEIVVVSGTPHRVLASTRANWYGKALTELPTAEVAADLSGVISSQVSNHHFNEPEHLFDITSPLLLSRASFNDDAGSIGAIMVHLDTRSMEQSIRQTTLLLSAGVIVVLLLLGAVAYGLFSHLILRPISAISTAITQDPTGQNDVWALTKTEDEIGVLASTLRASQAHAFSAMHELENQKFAVDQHAIVVMTDTQGAITYVNDRFCAISGYPQEELIGKNNRILNSGTHARAFFTEIWITIARGRVWHGEICNRAKNGDLYWINSTLVPLLDEKGKPRAYIAISTDITARKKSEAELQTAKAAAEGATSAKSDFLATMSHELRTPMNGVLGFAELLLDSPLNDKQLIYANTIKKSGESLLTILNDILDYSKIEAGKLSIEPIPFDLGEAVEQVTGLLAHRAEAKNLSLKVDYPPALPRFILCDPTRVRQILLNLIGNALKFTEHGSVALRLSETAHDGQRLLRFEVTDTGIGLTPEQASRLFQKFSQADVSTTRQYGGTGLGLAICKMLVELMDGEIGLESAPGRGSTFWFTLPLVAAAKPALPPEALRQSTPPISGPLPSATGAPNMRVLLAEDNTINQLFALALLEKFNCHTDLAATGVEAVALFESKAYDVILMDCRMPEMDGFQATAAIRKLERERAGRVSRIPIIALTANASKEDRERCLAANMDDFLTKPFRVIELEKMLERWAPRAPDRGL